MKIDGTLPQVRGCSEEGLRHSGVKSTETGRIDGGFPHHAGKSSFFNTLKQGPAEPLRRALFFCVCMLEGGNQAQWAVRAMMMSCTPLSSSVK